MARRMVRPRPRREGRGIGERMAEIAVYVVIIGAAVYAAHWYFTVHLRSPGVAMQAFMGTLKAGDPEKQYELLSSSVRAAMTRQDYERSHPLARGLNQRIQAANITSIREANGRAEVDVTVRVRRAGQELYQASVDTFRDHYVLVKERDGWKVALDDPKTNLGTLQAINRR